MGHRILGLTRKGGRRTTGPATTTAVDTDLTHRATETGVPIEELTGPLPAARTGHRLDQVALWYLTRRLARIAAIPAWAQLSPHSLRHTAITLDVVRPGHPHTGRHGNRRSHAF